jgi:hypothetical protein
MSSPIEDFLRQAAERRGSKPPPVIATQVQPEPEVTVAELVEAQELLENTHLDHHIDTSRLADHAEHLGEEVSRADEQVDKHVHAVFDHQVGALDEVYDSSDTTNATEGYGLRRELKQAVRSRAQIRRAVVFSEIIRRPEWRW